MTLNNTKVQDAERVAQIEEEQAQEARDMFLKLKKQID